MARKRRSMEVFSMSFLDCMSCGFGAVILFFMIINSHVNATTENDNSELMAETNRLEIEVLEGRKNLALARNTKQKLEVEKEDAESKIAQIIALIQELQAELDKYDAGQDRARRKAAVRHQVARGRGQAPTGHQGGAGPGR